MDAAWGLELAAPPGRTGIGCGWSREREDTMGSHLRVSGE